MGKIDKKVNIQKSFANDKLTEEQKNNIEKIETIENTINNMVIPTKVSELTNDSKYATEDFVTTRYCNAIDMQVLKYNNILTHYKDFEEILGYNSVTGLLQELSYEMDDLKSDMRSYERIVAENQERRRREEAARRAAAAAAAAAARRRY